MSERLRLDAVDGDHLVIAPLLRYDRLSAVLVGSASLVWSYPMFAMFVSSRPTRWTLAALVALAFLALYLRYAFAANALKNIEIERDDLGDVHFDEALDVARTGTIIERDEIARAVLSVLDIPAPTRR